MRPGGDHCRRNSDYGQATTVHVQSISVRSQAINIRGQLVSARRPIATVHVDVPISHSKLNREFLAHSMLLPLASEKTHREHSELLSLGMVGGARLAVRPKQRGQHEREESE
jgi:hypothetical protein